jgi:hypothetical protein
MCFVLLYWGTKKKSVALTLRHQAKLGQYVYVGITMPMLFLAVQSGLSALPFFLQKNK